MAKEKVLEWASYQCGLLYEKDEALSQMGKSALFDEAYLAQVREEKLHNMLAIEVFFSDKLSNYFHRFMRMRRNGSTTMRRRRRLELSSPIWCSRNL